MKKSLEEMQAEKEKLLADHVKYSKAEDTAKAKRLDIEAKIEAMYPFEDAKSKTFTEQKFKVILKKNFAMKWDSDKYATIRESIPEILRPEKIKYELDKEGFAWLAVNKPEIYIMVSDCLEEKQNKTTITVEKI